MSICVAPWFIGDLDQAVKRSIHLQHEKYGAGNREGTDEEDHDDRGVPRSK